MNIKPVTTLVSIVLLFSTIARADHFEDIQAVMAQTRSDSTGAEDEKLYRLFDGIWEYLMVEFPTYATYVGYPGQNDRWMDNSFEAEEKRDQLDIEILQLLETFDESKLSTPARLDWELVRQDFERSVQGQEFPDSLMPIDQMGGVQEDISRTIDMMPTSKFSEYEDILSRLESAEGMIANDVLRLKQGLAQGITPPQITLRDLPSQFEGLLVEESNETPFWKPFTRFPESIGIEQQEILKKRAASIIKQKLQPALLEIKEYLEEEYIPNARKSIGLSEMPNGAAWYAYRVQSTTTTDLTPEEIHQIGLDEVKRLSSKMREVIEETGFHGTFAAFQKFMQEDDQFYFADADALVDEYRNICKRADPELVKLFGNLPRLPYGVEVVAPHIAPSAPTAYYMGGSLEAGRAGFFYANTYDLRSRPIWGMEPLSLHEAVPGHHLQISIAKELGELHDLRKNLRFTAYVEGWGLYAETLGYEMGFYEDPYSRIGQISYEMWRAIRLVVDTGMHSLGWSRQQALDFFKEYSIMLEHDYTVEIDRYIVWPSQALAYKIGQLKFQELRDRSREALGEKFDVREFHDQVLGSGAIPLNVLENKIQVWINSQKNLAN